MDLYAQFSTATERNIDPTLEIGPKGKGHIFSGVQWQLFTAPHRDSCTVPRGTVCTHDPSFDGATGVSAKVCPRSLS